MAVMDAGGLTFIRFLGMNFVVAGFVSPELSSDFASKVGWGDFIAAVLALFSMARSLGVGQSPFQSSGYSTSGARWIF
jgi:hypothetical protein